LSDERRRYSCESSQRELKYATGAKLKITCVRLIFNETK